MFGREERRWFPRNSRDPWPALNCRGGTPSKSTRCLETAKCWQTWDIAARQMFPTVKWYAKRARLRKEPDSSWRGSLVVSRTISLCSRGFGNSLRDASRRFLTWPVLWPTWRLSFLLSTKRIGFSTTTFWEGGRGKKFNVNALWKKRGSASRLVGCKKEKRWFLLSLKGFGKWFLLFDFLSKWKQDWK